MASFDGDVNQPFLGRYARRVDDKPINMYIFCPKCHKQHVDNPNPAMGWDNPPHKSHLCHYCGAIFRLADVPTNGVKSIKTIGAADTWDITS